MEINVYTLKSFAKTKEGGNPAGIVMNADLLSEEEMQKIAAALGFSETAFVLHSNAADFKAQFFTPNEEVDLCGHATIPVFSEILDKAEIAASLNISTSQLVADLPVQAVSTGLRD